MKIGEKLSASGAKLTPYYGLCPWTPLVASAIIIIIVIIKIISVA